MNMIYYGDVFDSQEIVDIGLLLSQFKDESLTYIEFKEKMALLGYELDVSVIDSKRFKLLKDVEDFKRRVNSNQILSKDVDKYIAKTKDGYEVYFNYDRKMIEALASYGDEKAQRVLEGIRNFERKIAGKGQVQPSSKKK